MLPSVSNLPELARIEPTWDLPDLPGKCREGIVGNSRCRAGILSVGIRTESESSRNERERIRANQQPTTTEMRFGATSGKMILFGIMFFITSN